eukprot:CAMPEP_0168489278 /NCGR_PEP_ID=MMETSP0228-20121227/68580_1 /TAXON_ID=133427 /ORGANISM="Protoceratium reticulatum, Strain CCCM 535 (=CCMP 1889)" /LENGTH=51 /DNA_ID=CAMNT_0008505943 /DNA_START=20 /DNA_END=171 /DNA_ORIENTATION=-
MSLKEFVAVIPRNRLEVFEFHPQVPSKPNTYVNTLTLKLHVGPAVVKVGWS